MTMSELVRLHNELLDHLDQQGKLVWYEDLTDEEKAEVDDYWDNYDAEHYGI